jgi:16S rRNA (uracil1498-N3)-methyltransferase
MLRRIFIESVHVGDVALSPEAAHHARDVLRLGVGDVIELFDAAGATAEATILTTADPMVARVQIIAASRRGAGALTVASALPKGNRADWMIEKLAEIGVSRFVPLLTERSVVHPQGNSKLDRWNRLATEAARQSRGTGVMQIARPSKLGDRIVPRANDFDASEITIYCSTAPGAASLTELPLPTDRSILLLIGPEGGWSENELRLLAESGAAAAALTQSILRIETAALVAAGILLVRLG